MSGTVEGIGPQLVGPIAYKPFEVSIEEKNGVITLPDGRVFKVVRDEPKKPETSVGQKIWGVFSEIANNPLARAIAMTAAVILIKTVESMALKRVPSLPGGTDVQVVGTQLVTGVASELTRSISK